MSHHNRAPLDLNNLRPGYYRIRRVRSGPWIAAELQIADGQIAVTEERETIIAGIPLETLPDLWVEAHIEGEAFRHPLLRLLLFGVPIEAPEYNHMLATAAWARSNARSHPAANPDRPIDLGTIPIEHLF